MIVVLDMERRQLKVYTDKGSRTIMFEDVPYDLPDITNNGAVLYVTNAMETQTHAVIQLVNSFSQSSQPSVLSEHGLEAEDEEKFLQSTKGGSLVISDIDLVFRNSGDCKPLDDEMRELIQSSPLLRRMIDTRVVKIVNRRQVQRATREVLKKTRIKDAQQDAALNSIIVQNDGKSGSAEMLASGGSGGDEGAGVIDLEQDDGSSDIYMPDGVRE